MPPPTNPTTPTPPTTTTPPASAASTCRGPARGWQLIVPVGCALALAAAALAWRDLEVDAEYDRYHTGADALRSGRVDADPYHPFGLAMLGAVVGPLAGDTLRALRLLAAIAAGVVVLVTGALAERLRPGARLPAQLLAAGSPMVWWLGTMGSSDMVAAALLLGAVGLTVHGDGPLRARRALWIGVLLGFGVGVRYAVLPAVPLVAAWALGRRTPWRALAAGAAGVALGMLPNMALQLAATGAPFPADGWHNFYLELVLHFDLERLEDAKRDGTLPTREQFLREHGGAMLQSGVRDTGLAAQAVVPGMLLGALETPTPRWGWWWPTLLAAIGFAAARDRVRGAALFGVAAALTFGAGVLLDPRARLLLPVLPLVLVGLATGIRALPHPALRAVALGLALLVPLPRGIADFRQYLAREPRAEIAAVNELHRALARPLVVMSTAACLDLHVAARVVGYASRPLPDAATTWSSIRKRMAMAGADVFVTGATTNGRLFELLRDAAPPPDFELLHRGEGVIAFGRRVAPSPWIAAATIKPAAPLAGEPVTFTIELAPDVDRDKLSGAGVALRGPDGSEHLFDLPPVAASRCARTLPQLSAGAWRVTHFVLDRSGGVHRAAERVAEVRAR
jgi:hypothetical protein